MENLATGDLVHLTGVGPVLDGIVFDTPSRLKVVIAVVERGRGPGFRTVQRERLTARETEGSDDPALRLLIRRTQPPLHGRTRAAVNARKGPAGFTRGTSHRSTGR